jgi:copper resistance protein C
MASTGVARCRPTRHTGGVTETTREPDHLQGGSTRTPRTRSVGVLTASLLVALTALLGAGAWTAPPAAAHAALIASDPFNGSALPDFPPGVTLQFSDELEPLATVTVQGEDGTEYTAGGANVSGDTVIQRLSDQAGDGSYTITYEATAADGHVMTGEVQFAVGAEAIAANQSTEVAPAPERPAADAGGGDAWLWLGVALLLLAAAAAAFVVRRLRPASTRS